MYLLRYGLLATLCTISTASLIYPIKLCTGLNASMSHLQNVAIRDHSMPGSLLEHECVGIDPCSARNERGDIVPQNEWLWRNSSMLSIVFPADKPDPQEEHRNYFNLEYARVPAGIVVETCEPDFVAAKDGNVVCNSWTIVTVTGNCPSPHTLSYTLLDCLAPTEQASVSVSVPYQKSEVQMLFGGESWPDACRNASGLASSMCKFLETKLNPTISYSAPSGRAQLVRYRFAEGWGCYETASIGNKLSHYAMPNFIEACPPLQNGEYIDDKCGFTCDTGYRKKDLECVLGCEHATETQCEKGYYSTSTDCVAGGVQYYSCLPCPASRGSTILPWSASTPTTCLYQPCPAGKFEANGQCHDCEKHSYTASPNSTSCTSCEAEITGTYSAVQGATSCETCFTGVPASMQCTAGRMIMRNMQNIHSYFASDPVPPTTYKKVKRYCEEGYACLPCKPGHFQSSSDQTECVKCPKGKYQHLWQASACFDCAHGQSTNRSGAVHVSECVCEPGFE